MMKKNNVTSLIMIICILSVLLTACSASTNQSTSEYESIVHSGGVSVSNQGEEYVLPFELQDGILYNCSLSSRKAPYSSIEELAEHADIIVTGNVVQSTVYYDHEKMFTVHTIKIETVIKGDVSTGNTIYVRERGGITTYGEHLKHQDAEEKDFIDPTAESTIPDSTTFICGIDGHFPMTKDQEALLFLVDCTGYLPGFTDTLYGVVNTYEGKLYKTNDGRFSQVAGNTTGQIIIDNSCLSVSQEELSELQVIINEASVSHD